MPLTEVTRTLDDNHIVVSSITRKLYTLVELKDGKHIEDAPSDIIESSVASAYETALDKLREFALDDGWWCESVLDSDAVELFKACGITVPPKTETIHVKENGKFTWDENRKPITKVVTRDDTIWDSWDVDRSEFVLNSRAVIDERVYLRALQWYLSGKDIRDLVGWGHSTSPLAASPRSQRAFDLRSKDARIIREQGLVIHRVDGMWQSSTREFDLDYHYDGLSEQTRNDCNELLSDLCHEVISLLRAEMDYRMSEVALLEDAEANEYRFDERGRIA